MSVARPPAPASSSAATTEPIAASLSKLVELLTKVLAPTTILGALLFYLGWVRTDHILRRFGVDSSLISFSVNDYIMRSADTTLEPLRWLLTAALLMVLAHAVIKWLVTRYTRLAPLPQWVAVVVGVALAAYAEWARLHSTVELLTYSLGWTAGVGLGAYGLIYAPGVDRRARPSHELVTWVSAALFVLGVFWTLETYAALRGDELADGLADDRASSKPCVTVYSRDDLKIATPGVEMVELTDPNGAYRYQYTSMRLLIRSGDKLFLLPSKWDGSTPTTIVVNEDDALRVDFQPAGDGSACTRGDQTAKSDEPSE